MCKVVQGRGDKRIGPKGADKINKKVEGVTCFVPGGSRSSHLTMGGVSSASLPLISWQCSIRKEIREINRFDG